METPTELTARMTAKLLGLLLGAVLIILCGLYVYGMQRKMERLENAQVGSNAAATAAQTQATGYAQHIQDKEEVRERTERTLDAHPEYRDAPVPADVADLLRKPAGSR